MPRVRVFGLVPRNGDASVLTETRGDDDRGIVLEEAIDPPALRSLVYPFVVAFDDELVEAFYVLKVEPDGPLLPVDDKGRGLRWKTRTGYVHRVGDEMKVGE